MDNNEWTALIQSEEVKRNRWLIRRVARSIQQLDEGSSGELVSYVESLITASEIPLAVHMLRLAYDELGVEQPDIRRDIIYLMQKHRDALNQLFQCNNDFYTE